jgi:hypothetical protein
LYPLLFTSLAKAMVLVGQLAIQTLQPLHFSVSTTIAPLSAILKYFLVYRFSTNLDEKIEKWNKKL